MRSWIVLLSVTMLSGAFFVLILTSDNKVDSKFNGSRAKASIKEKKELSNIVDTKKVDRTIAAISPTPLAVKTELVGLSKKDLKKITVTNKRTQDWEEKFINSFKSSSRANNLNSLSILHKRSIIKKENRSARNFEHIVVRYKLPNGNPYSFEALIDSETGAMKQSWNKTRYEKRIPTVLDGTNKLMMRSN